MKPLLNEQARVAARGCCLLGSLLICPPGSVHSTPLSEGNRSSAPSCEPPEILSQNTMLSLFVGTAALQAPSSVTRRAVLSSAAALSVPAVASAFDLPGLEEFDGE